MARRKDHAPDELRSLIRGAARKIIASRGYKNLTARALAREIGYAPGTIYNFYRDMDALVAEVNFDTLGELENRCRERIAALPPDFSRVRALALAYVDFAHDNTAVWEAIFMRTRKNARLPKAYQQRILSLFELIEDVLRDCLAVPKAQAHRSARLLWACLHGIAVLTLDGRLSLVGIDAPHKIVDDLLKRYFGK